MRINTRYTYTWSNGWKNIKNQCSLWLNTQSREINKWVSLWLVEAIKTSVVFVWDLNFGWKIPPSRHCLLGLGTVYFPGSQLQPDSIECLLFPDENYTKKKIKSMKEPSNLIIPRKRFLQIILLFYSPTNTFPFFFIVLILIFFYFIFIYFTPYFKSAFIYLFIYFFNLELLWQYLCQKKLVTTEIVGTNSEVGRSSNLL